MAGCWLALFFLAAVRPIVDQQSTECDFSLLSSLAQMQQRLVFRGDVGSRKRSSLLPVLMAPRIRVLASLLFPSSGGDVC